MKKIYGVGERTVLSTNNFSVTEAAAQTHVPLKTVEALRDGGKIEVPPANTVPAGQVVVAKYKDKPGDTNLKSGLIEVVQVVVEAPVAEVKQDAAQAPKAEKAPDKE